MTSFQRISDISPDELHLLTILGLRQQIREDRNQASPPNRRTSEGEPDGLASGRALDAEVPVAEAGEAAGESSITE
jgi:hypothetical protein